MKLVTVFKAFNSAEAQMQRSRLEAAGLLASVKNEISAITTAAPMTTGGIQVQVPEDQVEAARELLSDPDSSTDEN
jgi:hypothetical protein